MKGVCEEAVRQKSGQSDRRHAIRFPIRCDIQYRVLGSKAGEQVGTGQTINLSSAGVLFTAAHVLPVKSRVQLSIEWPVRLDRECPLKMVVLGKVVRSEEGCAAVNIKHYELRTRASSDLLLHGPLSAAD